MWLNADRIRKERANDIAGAFASVLAGLGRGGRSATSEG